MKNFFTLIFLTLSCIVSFASANTPFNNVQYIQAPYYHPYVMVKSDVSAYLTKSNAASLMMCPSNVVVNLGPGECSAVVNYILDFSGSAPSPARFNPMNTDINIINSTTYCNQSQTSYSRSYTYSGLTDMDLTSVYIGVYESSNSPSVRINIYDANNVLLGFKLTNAPTLSRSLWTEDMTDAEIVIPANSTFRVEIVTNIPTISVFKIGRNTLGTAGAEATISSGCNSATMNTEVVTGTAGTPNSIIFGAVGQPQSINIDNVSSGAGANLESGDEFPIGVTQMNYMITYGDGTPSTTCPFTVEVIPFANPSTALACHDLVNVTLQDNCSTTITADMILQGDNYTCYDAYDVVVSLPNGQVVPNATVTAQHLGRTLKTQIKGPNGNICWGEIFIEDKTPAVLECEDFYTTCSNDLTPGSTMNPRLPISASIVDKSISDLGSKQVDISIVSLPGAVVQDLDVTINIAHPRLSDLSATITSPNGVTVPLFLSPTCTGNVFRCTANDESLTTISCELGTNNAVGEYRPITTLSVFDGLPVEGTWTVRIFDVVSGQVGTVEGVDLIFTQSGAEIPFPTSEDITAIADPGSSNLFIVNGLDECGRVELRYTDNVNSQPCFSQYSEIIERCWTATDDSGNISATCCQTIYVYRNGLSTLVFPPNYDGTPGNRPALSCELYGNDVPGVDVTGYPDGDLCSNVQLTEPEDVIIPICPKSYKVLRTHKVIEWCSGTVVTHIQVIKVEDNEKPVIDCPRDTIISSGDNNCSASYIAPRPTLVKECSGAASMRLSYAPGYTSNNVSDTSFTTAGVNQTTRRINPMPFGTSVVQWSVTDSCGNTSTCRYNVTVKDNALPNVVCDQFTVASITGATNGFATIDAITFDDGSNDNCGILKYEVRRMESGPCNLSTNLGPKVEFCCSEIGQNIMVMLQVTDINFNTNTCMVNVRVEDKLPPYITECPADITLDCQDDFEDLSVTGEPVAIDNCEVVSVKKQDSVNVNNCGVGTVIRTWTATDRFGLRHSCVQRITLRDNDPFFIYSDNNSAPDRSGDDVIWPANYDDATCFGSLHPDNLSSQYARPIVSDDNCSLVGMHYKDTQFNYVEGACIKVIREWTVIDWCTYDELNPGNGGIYYYTQILKVQNTTEPTFDGACEDIVIPSYGACKGAVNISKTATDDCPEANINLEWKYELFKGNDLFPFETRNSSTINTELADGEYRVRWTVEDKCGNLSVCTHKLTVRDEKKPTPICHAELAIAVMNSDGSVEIWAEDFDKGSFDNCTPQKNLYITFFNAKPLQQLINSVHYFIGDGILRTEEQYLAGDAQKWDPIKRTSSMRFTCADIPNGISEEISLQMSVMDSLRNQDYCTITLSLQDNANVCPNVTNIASVSGRIATNNGSGLDDVDVVIKSTNGEYTKVVKTGTTGQYSFNTLVPNRSYEVVAASNTDMLNGVSTLDLVMIQRHILGISTFNQPTKIIAADADNNERITAADLVALRKLILGVTLDLPNGQQSYRFVASDHEFANPQSPFPFKEKYDYTNLTINKSNQNFVPVKIGDVNDSAVFGAQSENTESRSKETVELYSEAKQYVTGQSVRIPVYANSASMVTGLQGTIMIDPAIVTITNIEIANPSMRNDYLSTHAKDKGYITFCISDNKGLVFNQNEPMFYINGLTQKAVNGDLIQITSDITPAIAYNSNNEVLKLASRQMAGNGIILMQNTPNPFSSETIIRFDLPAQADATLRITDVSGRIIKTWTGNYPAGVNEIKVNRNEIQASGVVTYQLISGDNILTKKMILMDAK